MLRLLVSRSSFQARKQCRAFSLSSGYLESVRARKAPLDVHPEVQDALSTRKPVVALETTLVTHGFPYPVNYNLALELEQIVRSQGAIPATIGILGGRVKIGLQQSELQRLADTENNRSIVKISRRDIAPAIATGTDGGTTCSATLIFAAMAGIKVFATGGLGGVHRGAESSMDISADLHELTRCPVGLVSSGVKSILDIGRTLEYLETLGVPVLSYGKTRDFPAFFSPRSGFQVPWNVETPSKAASVLHTQWQLGMENGTLIAVPIPNEFEAAGAEIQKAVEQAVAESEENGISKRGKEVTPWLLARIGELTEGRSLTSNIALLKNTALVGAQIAVQYEKLANEQAKSDPSRGPSLHLLSQASNPTTLSTSESTAVIDHIAHKKKKHTRAKLVVLGAAAVDVSAHQIISGSAAQSTVPSSVSVSLGGVGRNVAEASYRLLPDQDDVLLVSPIGDDTFGQLLTDKTKRLGMRNDGLLVHKGQRTAVCNMMLDANGDLITGIADMDIVEELAINKALGVIHQNKPDIVAFDGNLSADAMTTLLKSCIDQGIKVLYEPTSVTKSSRVLKAVQQQLPNLPSIDFISPNLLELSEIHKAVNDERQLPLLFHPSYWATLNAFSLGSHYRMDLERLSRMKIANNRSKGTLEFLVHQGIAQMAVSLLPFFRHIVVKCGEMGVLVVMRVTESVQPASQWLRQRSDVASRFIVSHGKGESVIVAHFPALPAQIMNVTGAGDSFVGALLAGLVKHPDAFDSHRAMSEAMNVAQRAAVMTLNSQDAVSPQLSDIEVYKS